MSASRPFSASSRLLRPDRPFWSRRRFLGGMTGAAVGAAVLEPLFEPYAVGATHYETPLAHLPAEHDRLRVAFLTDLHRGELTPDASIVRAVELARSFEPDLLLLGGDYVRWRLSDAEACATMLAEVRPRLGAFACLGNHDYEHPEKVAELLERIVGARVLRNASAEAVPGLRIAGIEDTWRGTPDPRRALRSAKPREGLIFLTHNPVGVKLVSDRKALTLAGHTHGGQIRVPGMKPHYPPGMDGFPQIDGWGEYDAARLYISRGVGQTAVAFRWNCPPEVTLFTLRAG